MSYWHATRNVPTVQAFAQLVSSSQARTRATGKCNTVINIPWRIITGHFFQILPLIFIWTQQEITKKILSPEAVEAFLKKQIHETEKFPPGCASSTACRFQRKTRQTAEMDIDDSPEN